MQHGDALELILTVVSAVIGMSATSRSIHRVQTLTTKVYILETFCSFVYLRSWRIVLEELPYAHFVSDCVTPDFDRNANEGLLLLALTKLAHLVLMVESLLSKTVCHDELLLLKSLILQQMPIRNDSSL